MTTPTGLLPERKHENTILAAQIYADLGGVVEVADSLGVKELTVRRWLDRRAITRCPRPVCSLRNGNIYSLVEWRGWYTLWRITRGDKRRTIPTPDKPLLHRFQRRRSKLFNFG